MTPASDVPPGPPGPPALPAAPARPAPPAPAKRPPRAGSAARDWTDGHVARWEPVLPGLDPDIEGAVTRAKALTDHLRRVRERSLVDFGLHKHEFDTLHTLAGRGGRAAPSELAADLKMAPASITGRLDGLEQRGFVRRSHSAEDRRRVDVELTEEGRAAWLGALDVVGHEEYRLLGTLSPAERRTLSDLLRRIMVVAEDPDDGS
ncbi:MarR family transcriptional regulator [Streptomyces sp. NBC_00669]|uniref:MarR family winged helix-turn-helix transcriptional regulator n=1 Tax=Streptomyces sp. NBC_00669 TaxID=2976011 RepID=UPI002E37D175|nr:MarR family transcriptional regulator [Streptomyces sp. NBC_00669]